MGSVQHRDGLGVPPPQMQAGARFPLQVLAAFPRPQAGAQAAVGFPLQSLTRDAFEVTLEQKHLTDKLTDNTNAYQKCAWQYCKAAGIESTGVLRESVSDLKACATT